MERLLVSGRAVCFLLVSFFAAVTCTADPVLETPAFRICFDEAACGFAVTGIVNRLAGDTVFVHAGAKGPRFWRLTFSRAGKTGDTASAVTLTETSPARSRRVIHAPGRLTFIWEGLDLPERGGCPVESAAVDVLAEIRASADGTSADWTLSVTNRSSRYALFETHYPCLNQTLANGEGDVLIPSNNLGARLQRHRVAPKRNLYCSYMGYQPMMSAFMKGTSGLFVFAPDSAARMKTFCLEGEQNLSFATIVENAGVVGKAAEGPRYPVRTAVFSGDWWAAARLYRAWAVRQKWTSKGPIAARGDYPKRMAEIPLWFNIHGSPANVSNVLARAKARFPHFSSGLHWHLWQHSPHDVNYPEYFPAQPGTKEVLAFCSSIGQEALPYTNGRLWTVPSEGFRFARGCAVTRPDGTPYIEHYGTLTPPLAPMCPFTSGWQNTVSNFSERILTELGARSLFLDQIGAAPARPCYNPTHGHPVGGGTWWFDGYQKLLVPIHEAYASHGAFLTTEGSAETWMNTVDGYLVVTERSGEDVPFYPAVYSGYTAYFCSPENIMDEDSAFWALQARELLWGVALGWYHPDLLDRENKCVLVERLCRFRQKWLNGFAYGTLVDTLRPLDPLPMIGVEWLGRKAFYLWRVKNAPLSPSKRVEMPAVIGTVWRLYDSPDSAVFAANLTERPQKIRFQLPSGGIFRAEGPEGDPACSFRQKGREAIMTLPPRALVAVIRAS